MLGRIRLQGGPLYAIMILSIGFFANGIATVLHGNGLLSLYVAAIIIGSVLVDVEILADAGGHDEHGRNSHDGRDNLFHSGWCV